MKIVVRREIPQDETLRAEWNRLVEAMASPAVFFTYEWALAAAHAFGASRVPLLMLAYEKGSLLGVAALATPAGTREVHFLASTTADYCDFVCAPQIRSQFVNIIFSELRVLKVRSLVLANFPGESATDTLARCARSNGYHLFCRPAYECAQVILSSPERREFVKRSLRKKRGVQRVARALATKGPVRLSHLHLEKPVASALPHFFLTHVARFLSTGRISNLARPERRAFLEELATLLSNSGWMRFSCLSVGGREFAWHYGFKFAGNWSGYQVAFDPEFHEYFPGIALLEGMIAEACDTSDIRCFDLGLGTEKYKRRFATASRHTLHITVSRSWFGRAKQSIRFHLLSAVKLRPEMEAALRKVVGLFKIDGRFGWESIFRVLSPAGLWDRVLGRGQVIFYEWPHTATTSPPASDPPATLRPITLDLLAGAAMHYVEEQDTLAYLIQAAARLASGEGEGFALLNGENTPVHFWWVTDLQKFRIAEPDRGIQSPHAEGAVIFDCWTPASCRGPGHFRQTVAEAVRNLQNSDKRPWILAPATERGSIREVQEAGFERRFSLRRKHFRSANKTFNLEKAGYTGATVTAPWAT